MKKLLLIGGGGHCKSVIDSVLSSGEYDEIGIIDKAGTDSYQGIPVAGDDNDLQALFSDGWKYAFITVGSIGNTGTRRKLYRIIKETGFTIPVICDSSAVIARDADIDEGVFIGKKAVVNSCSRIGRCAIINTGAIIEHDCSISDFAHISPGAVLCGQITVGEDSHIGAGTVIRQSVSIGKNVLVGAGSTVVKDLSDNVKAFGNPCKVTD